jgi:hypothetical protein
MNCENINNLFLDYLDNNLSPFEIEKVETHLAQCASCSTKLEQFKNLNEIFVKTNKVKTPQSFKNEFASILEAEKSKISKSRFSLSSIKSTMKIAASILIFVAGTIFGIIIQNQSLSTSKISKLEYELNNLKQQVIFETLKNQSASEKIQAINFTTYNQNIERKLADILVETLNTDENINVRLAALDALSQFSNEPSIRNGLINSLSMQENPYLQVGLIKVLINFNSPDANEAIHVFLNQNDLQPDVKNYAKELIHKNTI